MASQSPRRKQLLEWAEIPFEIVVQETGETYPDGLKVDEVAIHIAREKALAVQSMVEPDAVILAADTIVVLKGRIIGKPKDRGEAIRILSDLSGQKHEPMDGVVTDAGIIDLVFVPLLIVDKLGYRIGYGKGFYDKYLPHCRPDCLKVGFCYFEPIEEIEGTHEFDVPLNLCITPNKFYVF